MTEVEYDTSLSRRAKIYIALGICVIAAPILYAAAVMIAMKAHSKEDCGKMHLRNIGVRCREYAENHGGQFPAKWSDLQWDDMGGITNSTWGQQFVCPTIGRQPGDWKQVDCWSDYRLIPGRTTNDWAYTILAIEPLSNHGTGANVLFVNGGSTWLTVAQVLGREPLPKWMNQ